MVCHECPDGPTMLTPDDAALLTGVSTRLIYRWVEAGRIHFYERRRRAFGLYGAVIIEVHCLFATQAYA